MIRLLAYSPFDGWGFFTKGKKLYLVQPPYSLNNISEISENELIKLIDPYDFVASEESFKNFYEMFFFLKNKYVKMKEFQEKPTPSKTELNKLLKYANSDIINYYLIQIKNDLLINREYNKAKDFLQVVNNLDIVKNNISLHNKVNHLINHCNQEINNVDIVGNKIDNFIPKNLLISIIIPVFNEGSNIKSLIERIPSSEKFEIIVIDDGSTDNTYKKLREINKNLNILRHEVNVGYTKSLLAGFKKSHGDIIITLDADGEYDPLNIYDLIKPIIKNEAHLVIGSRNLGKYDYLIPKSLLLFELFIGFILSFMFKKKVKDNLSSFRAFKRSIMKIYHNISIKSIEFLTESLLKAAYYNYKILEIPIKTKKIKYGFYRYRIITIFKSIFRILFKFLSRSSSNDYNKYFLVKFYRSFEHIFEDKSYVLEKKSFNEIKRKSDLFKKKFNIGLISFQET